MEIFGLPAHALVVHAAVVLTPLAVLLAIGFALRPSWRYLLRWPTAVLAVVATASVWLSRLTGPSLQHERSLPDAFVETHRSRANVLFFVMIAFLVLALLGTLLLGGPSGLASGRGGRDRAAGFVEVVLPLALVVVGIVVTVWLVLTGDAGARMVWG
jgi:hypothetical protein